jgi:hypothetical protein
MASKRTDVVEDRANWIAGQPDVKPESLLLMDEAGARAAMRFDGAWAPAGVEQ